MTTLAFRYGNGRHILSRLARYVEHLSLNNDRLTLRSELLRGRRLLHCLLCGP